MADSPLGASAEMERAQARLSTPLPERSFQELTDSLSPRPRYLGPGKWKQLLSGMLATEEPFRD
jgi:hypothetical protein